MERIQSRSASSGTSVRFKQTSVGKPRSRYKRREATDLTQIYDSKPSTASLPGEWSDADDWASDTGDIETDEGRLSRSLQRWMPEYKIEEMHILKPPVEPIFTGRLGQEPRVQSQSSADSVVTQLSLFSCSSCGDKRSEITQNKRVRKRKHLAQQAAENEDQPKQESVWEQYARRKAGAFDILAKRQRAMHGNIISVVESSRYGESDIFELMDDDEKKMLFNCALKKGICGLKKSGSMTNIHEEGKAALRRVASANSKKGTGKPLNFEELKKQVLIKKLAVLTKNQRRKSRNALRSRMSITSLRGHEKTDSDSPANRESPLPPDEEKIKMWKGDEHILEIDLKRELTSNVKSKIKTTNEALERITGFGDTNESLTIVGRHEEFPKCVEEDYSVLPRIMQRMRISADLSSVIKNDIKVRMGRPRYHEICVRDMERWDKGQVLDTFHRNLKVFTWLHSLREKEFTDNVHPVISDRPDPPKVVMHVEAVDEPTIKPLYAMS